MAKLLLREEVLRPEFAVWVSNKVNNYIGWVIDYNKNNPNAIKSFYESLEELNHHLSFRSVGLNYGVPYPFTELGLSVHYNLKFDVNDQPYINIFRIKIDFEYFGLVDPHRKPIQKRINRITLKETQLRSIIRETLKQVLLTT